MKISNCNGEKFEREHPKLAPSSSPTQTIRKGRLFEAKIRERKKKA